MALSRETIETDVLIIGGGLAGCMAAIRASEIVGGRNVLIAEKAHIRRSGNAATGVDHTWSYMPEIHAPMGFTIEQLVEDHVKAMGELQDRDILYTIASTINERIKDLEKWGFPVKTGGEWNYVKKIHRVPTFLHWAGRDQKKLFARQVSRRRIKVLNRVDICELLVRDGEVVGAIGFGIREPVFYTILAKSTVITTGGIARLFPGISSWEFNRATHPHCTGDGVAMAYRAGAEVTGLEFLYRHTGPKNFHKKGRGSWIGVTEDALGEPIVKAQAEAPLSNDLRKKVDTSVESPGDMRRIYEEGRGPVLMNCRDTPDADIDYMRWALMNEGNVALLRYMDENGIDPRRSRIEFTTYEPELRSGVMIDSRAATSVPGLFAAGDTIGNVKRGVSPGAFAMGWIAGESAARRAEEGRPGDATDVASFADEKRSLFDAFLDRDDGASWKEALAACQDIMNWYGGTVRYETLLKAGIAQMRRLRAEALDTLSADNNHELMHCLSALNLMDVGEASMLSALQRKESRRTMRENFIRVDYPDENEDMNKFLVHRLNAGKPVFSWREPKAIS